MSVAKLGCCPYPWYLLVDDGGSGGGVLELEVVAFGGPKPVVVLPRGVNFGPLILGAWVVVRRVLSN